jgi:hypothetical protein
VKIVGDEAFNLVPFSKLLMKLLMMFAVFANAYFLSQSSIVIIAIRFGVNHVVEIAEHLFQSIFGDRFEVDTV